MANVAELAADIKLNGAKDAAKEVDYLIRELGFLGNVLSGVGKAFSWGIGYLKQGEAIALNYARAIDNVTFSNDLSINAIQRIEQAMSQYGKTTEDFTAVYNRLQNKMWEWKRNPMSQQESEAFTLLEIAPGSYNDPLELLDAISSRLENIRDKGKKNAIMSALGITPDYQYVYEQHAFNVKNNLNQTEEEKKNLLELKRSADILDNTFSRLKMKLGTKWAVDWGMDLTRETQRVVDKMNDAADAANGFWDAVLGVGKVGVDEFDNIFNVTPIGRWIEKWESVAKAGATGDVKKLFPYLFNSFFDFYKSKNSSTTAPVNGASAQNGEYIIQRLMKEKGYTRTSATAIVGNLFHESAGLNPLAVGDNGTSFGIAQWHDGRDAKRWSELVAFSKANGKDYRTLEAQVDFLIYELGKQQYAKTLSPDKLNRLSLRDATQLFEEDFENPKEPEKSLPHRYNAAVNLLDNAYQADRFTDMAQNAVVSESTRNVAYNNNVSMVINADQADQGLVVGSVRKALENVLNTTSIQFDETYGVLKNG